MKALITFFFWLNALALFGQIPNAGFENRYPNRTLMNWVAKSHLISVSIDSNGHSHSDSTRGLNNLVIADSLNARNGQFALRLKNGINVSKGELLDAAVRSATDSASYGFFTGNFGINQLPEYFSFYYKFSGLPTDTAWVEFSFFDETDELLYKFNSSLPVQSNYVPVVIPLFSPSSKPHKKASILFSAAKLQSEDLPNKYFSSEGATLWVDDLEFIFPSSVSEINPDLLKIYPVPARSFIAYELKSQKNQISKIEILDFQGRQMISQDFQGSTIELESLPEGIYFLRLITNNGALTKPFTISR